MKYTKLCSGHSCIFRRLETHKVLKNVKGTLGERVQRFFWLQYIKMKTRNIALEFPVWARNSEAILYMALQSLKTKLFCYFCSSFYVVQSSSTLTAAKSCILVAVHF